MKKAQIELGKISFNQISTITKYFVYIVTIITVFAVFVPLDPQMPLSGVDPSWIFSMNESIRQNLSIGKEIVFTYGPYASIYTRAYHPATDCLMMFGSFILGFIVYSIFYGKSIPVNLRDMITIGFIGALTTMSTLSYESFRLAELNEIFFSCLNIFLNIFLCLLAIYFGKELSLLINK